MTTNNEEYTPRQQLKNLRNKAELCRYAHSHLHNRYVALQRYVVIFIATVSFIMTLRVLGYFPAFSDWKEWMTIIGIVLSASILFAQILSYTLGWREKEIEHATSLKIWGRWIHNARFLQRNMSKYTDTDIDIKIEEMYETYGQCMEQTVSIPSDKFLIYKAKFKKYVGLSKQIDTSSQEELDGIISEVKKRKIS